MYHTECVKTYGLRVIESVAKGVTVSGSDIEMQDLAGTFPGLYNIFIEGEPIPEGLPDKEIRRRIYEGEILMPEWIVRGEGPEEQAIETAAKVIAVRRTGRNVTHRLDPGRQIMIIPFKSQLSRKWNSFARTSSAAGIRTKNNCKTRHRARNTYDDQGRQHERIDKRGRPRNRHRRERARNGTAGM